MSSFYLKAAEDAVDYVHGKLTIGSSNKPRQILASIGQSILCVAAIRSVDIATGEREPMMGEIRQAAAKAEHVGCGNCGESAALAFVYLAERHVRPLDYMVDVDADHAFVVIGRAKASKPEDPNTWGRDAVVCDPWGGLFADRGKAFPASTFRANMYKGGHMKPASVYRVE